MKRKAKPKVKYGGRLKLYLQWSWYLTCLLYTYKKQKTARKKQAGKRPAVAVKKKVYEEEDVNG